MEPTHLCSCLFLSATCSAGNCSNSALTMMVLYFKCQKNELPTLINSNCYQEGTACNLAYGSESIPGIFG